MSDPVPFSPDEVLDAVGALSPAAQLELANIVLSRRNQALAARVQELESASTAPENS